METQKRFYSIEEPHWGTDSARAAMMFALHHTVMERAGLIGRQVFGWLRRCKSPCTCPTIEAQTQEVGR